MCSVRRVLDRLWLEKGKKALVVRGLGRRFPSVYLEVHVALIFYQILTVCLPIYTYYGIMAAGELEVERGGSSPRSSVLALK